jgi:hypothetical protein
VTCFSDDLHIFLTMTNLRGVPYTINFRAGERDFPYVMSSHGDWAHYCLTGLGGAAFASLWSNAGYFIPLPSSSLPASPEGVKTDPLWRNYLTHALTSGAFPIGLEARPVELPLEAYERRIFALPYSLSAMTAIKPSFPQGFTGRSPAPTSVAFAGVDGGALDNDPFQILRYHLMPDPPHDPPGEADTAESCVIMISPFPQPPEFEVDDAEASRIDILSVAKRVVLSLMQNARYKPNELMRTLDVNNVSAWRIAPTRWEAGRDQVFTIACGLFGGFGGFLDREFRRHDYELGRQNCQRFLSHWFGVSPDNANVDPLCPLPLKISAESVDHLHLPKDRVAIIPLYGSAARPVERRPWPRVTPLGVKTFLTQIENRVNAFKAVAPSTWAPWIIWGLWRKSLRAPVQKSVLGDLIKRDQYGAALTDEERVILLAILDINPAGTYFDDLDKRCMDQPGIKAQLPAILSELTGKGLIIKVTPYLSRDYWKFDLP